MADYESMFNELVKLPQEELYGYDKLYYIHTIYERGCIKDRLVDEYGLNEAKAWEVAAEVQRRMSKIDALGEIESECIYFALKELGINQ